MSEATSWQDPANVLARLFPALTEMPAALRDVLAKWVDLDDDLREQIAIDVEWILSAVCEQLDAPVVVADRVLVARVAVALRELAPLADDAERLLGVRLMDFQRGGA